MMAFLQSALLYVLPFLFVITVIVTVHELGHFVMARTFGVEIDRFSIGFGRPLLSWKASSGMQWRIGWLPLGGYVRFAGDDNAASVPDRRDLTSMRAAIVAREGAGAERKYFHFKPLWQRATIVAAGPMANFILSICLFGLLFGTIGEAVSPFRVGSVQAGSPAARAGIMAGDRIVAADGHRLRGFEDLQRYVIYRDGVAIDFSLERGREHFHTIATPRRQLIKTVFGGVQNAGLLGIRPIANGGPAFVRSPPLTALGKGAAQTWDVLGTTVFYLGRMITGQVSARQIHGIVGIAQASGSITRQAIDQAPHDLANQALGVAVNLTNLAALISVTIGFMNLLPIPVLDGGHLLFYAYEGVARRPVAAAVQAAGYRVGLALLLCLMLFATWNDLQPLRVFHFFGSLFS